jgi:hypothetical protein
MRHYINIFTLILLITGCKDNTTDSEKVVEEIFHCKKGEMTSAWYEHGIDEPIPNIQGLKNGFIIVVDTSYKALNFISFDEDYSRERSIELDTTDLYSTDDWEKLTTKQKLEKVIQEKKLYKIRADSTHILNNHGQQQVWIINNSKDTITIQMQDWSFICVLQAKTKSGNWYPIQYWRFSTCGNSYYLKHFPPKTANSFITKLPNEGDYKTKLRYKLLGTDKFYYSNEFDGTIKYCEFVEDSTNLNRRPGTTQPHYKLDTLINLVW